MKALLPCAAALALALQPAPPAAARIAASGKSVVRPIGPVSTALGGASAGPQTPVSMAPAAVPGSLPSAIPSARDAGPASVVQPPSVDVSVERPAQASSYDRSSSPDPFAGQRSETGGVLPEGPRRSRDAEKAETSLGRLERTGERIQEARPGPGGLSGVLDDLFIGG